MPPKAAIYLDSNAGAPLKLEVLEALLPFFNSPTAFIPNPSSIHSYGRFAKRTLAEARERVAASLGSETDSEQILFTSSGSEANQLVIRSIFEPKLHQGERPHWITTEVEHDSIRQMVFWIEKNGGTLSYLPVDSQTGAPRMDLLPSLVRPETALVSSIWVNNETGVISDIHKLSALTQAYSIPLHLDASQAWGKLQFNVHELGAQWITFSGHKIGALAGCGALWIAKGQRVEANLPGKQEKGRRGGTENLAGIIAMGAAAHSLQVNAWVSRVTPVRDRLEKEICTRIPGVQINGVQSSRIANTLNVTFDGIEGEGLVMALDLAGYAVSSGSACSSGAIEPSHVLIAMGRTRAQAMSALRISLVDEMDWEILEGFVNALEQIVTRMRKRIE